MTPGARVTGPLAAQADVDALLARLEGARSVGPDHWVARCPAHEDRRPSLDLRLAHDGRILLCCRAACPTDQVLRELSLDWSALFPDRDRHPSRRPQNESEEQAARREIFARAARARERRKTWLPIWLASDRVRELTEMSANVRTTATGLGDTPASWALLAFAAAIEVEAFNTEATLDTAMAERRRA